MYNYLYMFMSLYTIASMNSKLDQKHKMLKAKVAAAMYVEFEKVPTEEEIENMYRTTRVLYRAVLGTHYVKRKQEKSGQLVLF